MQGVALRSFAVVDSFAEEDYMVTVDVDLNPGNYGAVLVLRADPSNAYVVTTL